MSSPSHVEFGPPGAGGRGRRDHAARVRLARGAGAPSGRPGPAAHVAGTDPVAPCRPRLAARSRGDR